MVRVAWEKKQTSNEWRRCGKIMDPSRDLFANAFSDSRNVYNVCVLGRMSPGICWNLKNNFYICFVASPCSLMLAFVFSSKIKNENYWIIVIKNSSIKLYIRNERKNIGFSLKNENNNREQNKILIIIHTLFFCIVFFFVQKVLALYYMADWTFALFAHRDQTPRCRTSLLIS